MSSLLDQVRIRIQNPNRTTSINEFSPRRRALFSPAPLPVVEATEVELGFKLPPLLSQLYTQVGNGGFGPGYGIFGLEGGYADPVILFPETVNQTKGGILTDWYFCYRGMDPQLPELDFDFMSGGKPTLFIEPEPRSDTWNWFDKLMPISNHGCWQISCIDCSKSSFPVLLFDGQQCLLQIESRTFDEWIESWLNSSPGENAHTLR